MSLSRRDSLIYMKDGIFRLDELGSVFGFEYEQKIDCFPFTKFYMNGNIKTFIIRTAEGIEIEVGEDSFVLCANNNHLGKLTYTYNKVSSLRYGDVVPVFIGEYNSQEKSYFLLTPIKQKTQYVPAFLLDNEIAYFIGILSSSCFVEKNIITIYVSNESYIHVNKILMEHFVFCEFENITYHDSSITFESDIFCKWMIDNKIYFTKQVPLFIRTSSASIIESFLKGVGEIGLINKTDEFIQQIQCLYRYIGKFVVFDKVFKKLIHKTKQVFYYNNNPYVLDSIVDTVPSSNYMFSLCGDNIEGCFVSGIFVQ